MTRRSLILTRFLILGVGVGLLFRATSLGPAAPAAERILSFHSEIMVQADASMLVRETIRVRAEGVQIKRGIYRDFPTRYKDRLGNRYVVGFAVLEVLRDGNPDGYRLEDLSNGKRVYMGKKDVYLAAGEYSYTLVYATDRQLGFFADHDELYWNVTGNGWAFPMDQASATVTLPAGVARDAILLDAYTGPQGSAGTDFKASLDSAGAITFSTTRALQPQEGLTIVVSWPKGFIAEPTREVKFQYFLEDNRSAVVGVAGLVILLAYYLLAWIRVGKDPAAGTLVTLYEPPTGFSPAAVRNLHRLGFDHKTFAANIINLAVKKLLTIKEDDGVYTLTRRDGQPTALTADEKAIVDKLFGSAKSIKLEVANHARIGGALEALRKTLRANLEKVYFFTNRWYLIPGLALSLLTLVLAAAAVPGEQKFTAVFICVWLLGWSVAVIFLVSQALHAWKNVLYGRGHKAASKGAAISASLFALPFLAGELAGLGVLGYWTSPLVIVILAALIFVNYLFHHLLKAPTRAGRTLLDKIEGFKVFLSAVEKDRLNLLNPPERTPELFERYLPYALALDVEQAWSEQFADVLARAGKGGETYSPAWYSGSGWRNLGSSGFASSLGSSFSGAIASSSTAPGSSSGGGGGGSSGGGGGGGGGGGW